MRKRKKGELKAPSYPQKDKMIRVASRKSKCPTCNYFYAYGLDVCPDCGRPEGGTTAVKTK